MFVDPDGSAILDPNGGQRRRCRSTTSSASAPLIAGRAVWHSRSRPKIRRRFGRKTPRSLADRSAPAQLILRWLLEPGQQNAIAQGGAWSPRLDIAPPPGLAPLAELNVANGFLKFITDTAVAQEYRDRFATLIGPVTGPEHR